MSKLNNAIFHKISIEEYNRKEHFYFYLNAIPCTYSLTVELDIGSLLEKISLYKKNNILIYKENIKFYPIMIYLISLSVNEHNEFKMCFRDGDLGYYNIVHPSYTIFNKESKTFSSIYTEYNEDFISFYKNYTEDINLYSNTTHLSPKEYSVDNVFNISILPNVKFTSFNLNLEKGFKHLLPIFTMGKYYKNTENKTLIPISIQVHHSVCDGYHIGLFIETLQNNINSFLL